MPKPPSPRPTKGLTPEEALARWSDPVLHNELIAIAEKSDLPTLQVAGHHILDPTRLENYRDKREVLEVALVQRLRGAEIFASGLAKYAPRREIIHPTLWDTLCVTHDFDEIVGNGHFYEYAEFFEPPEIPTNLDPIPSWFDDLVGSASANAFWHDRDYKNIEFRRVSYALSDLHARIVGLLHQAFLDGDPWQRGKPLLAKAGSAQIKMSDVFKSRPNWRDFIEHNGKGMYRLRLEAPISKLGRP